MTLNSILTNIRYVPLIVAGAILLGLAIIIPIVFYFYGSVVRKEAPINYYEGDLVCYACFFYLLLYHEVVRISLLL